MTRAATVAEVQAVLETAYDPHRAEDWDAVGLVTGDPADEVRRILLAVDPTHDVIDEAIAEHADLLVTHHPLLLRPVNSVAATTPKGRAVHKLIGNRVALITAHTNADAPPGGVSDAMAQALGIDEAEPIVAQPSDPQDKLVTFVPQADAARVIDALAAAGAGDIGAYERCAYTSPGTGTFRPTQAANPTIGEVGAVEEVAELRVEMVVPRAGRAAVVAALRAAHPYEEAAFDVYELATQPSRSGSGRIGGLAAPTTLGEFATAVVDALPGTASVARVAGDPEQPVRTVALCGGAGDFLLDQVRATDADVYVTSDLRHHPASELREHGTPALIDVPHWAAEWTWLPVAERVLTAALAAQGITVDTRVSTIVTDPWTG
ncbi:MAG TPA: Nif3-like dinuclear metal center hexameric protein, partial [Nocardioidaceae bacterium]|nr:Nif3-like dinuclear metal center hexameric protein [Nocardioidaceae bacterium]